MSKQNNTVGGDQTKCLPTDPPTPVHEVDTPPPTLDTPPPICKQGPTPEATLPRMSMESPSTEQATTPCISEETTPPPVQEMTAPPYVQERTTPPLQETTTPPAATTQEVLSHCTEVANMQPSVKEVSSPKNTAKPKSSKSQKSNDRGSWWRFGKEKTTVSLEAIPTWEEKTKSENDYAGNNFKTKKGTSNEEGWKGRPLCNPALSKKVSLWRGDITTLQIDAIVNAANRSLLGGGGVDGAIHSAAGSNLLKECRKLGGCDTGDAKITSGYKLPAKYVIHTVGPTNGSRDKLRSCYSRCLQLALENNIRSLAFCCIATGIYGYPNKDAAHVALETVQEWLQTDGNADKVHRIIFCVFLDIDYEIYKSLLQMYFPVKSQEQVKSDQCHGHLEDFDGRGGSGSDGTTGNTGGTAPSGSDGTTGNPGGTAPSGSDGTTGNPGGTAPSGSDEATGNPGGTAPSGSDGATGNTVGTAPSGSDGTTGNPGGTAPSGSDEATGNTGGAAPSGSDGTTGNPGGTAPSGSDEATGNPGGTVPSGSDGTTGNTGGTVPSGSDDATGNPGGTAPSSSDGTTGTAPSNDPKTGIDIDAQLVNDTPPKALL
ncbi:hypothetical protein EMCRGX_G033019 [Ephydatia muelleri]